MIGCVVVARDWSAVTSRPTNQSLATQNRTEPTTKATHFLVVVVVVVVVAVVAVVVVVLFS